MDNIANQEIRERTKITGFEKKNWSKMDCTNSVYVLSRQCEANIWTGTKQSKLTRKAKKVLDGLCQTF